MSAYPNPTLHEGPNGLELEGVSLVALAERHGTPSYIYSREALSAAYRAYASALEGHRARIFYAVKANSNLAVLNLFARLGAGFDIVSGGELSRVLAAGARPGGRVLRRRQIRGRNAPGTRGGIRCFNVESAAELERLAAIAAQMGKVAPIALRVNPDVDPKTHPYISTGLRSNKFGVAFDEAMTLYRRAATLPGLKVSGIACHIGSQLLDPRRLQRPPTRFSAWSTASRPKASRSIISIWGWPRHPLQGRDATLAGGLPGATARALQRPQRRDLPRTRTFADRQCGAAADQNRVSQTRRRKNFAVVDAAMNDLARPALYDAFHDVVAVCPGSRGTPQRYEIVGPICEKRRLPRPRPRAERGPGRAAGPALGRRLRHDHELQLQHSSARCRGDGGRQPQLADPRARAGRGSVPRRAGARRRLNAATRPPARARRWSRCDTMSHDKPRHHTVWLRPPRPDAFRARLREHAMRITVSRLSPLTLALTALQFRTGAGSRRRRPRRRRGHRPGNGEPAYGQHRPEGSPPTRSRPRRRGPAQEHSRLLGDTQRRHRRRSGVPRHGRLPPRHPARRRDDSRWLRHAHGPPTAYVFPEAYDTVVVQRARRASSTARATVPAWCASSANNPASRRPVPVSTAACWSAATIATTRSSPPPPAPGLLCRCRCHPL